MYRPWMIVFGLTLAFSPLAGAQTSSDIVPVKATDVSFYDQFDFQSASGSTALPSGVLKTGGFTAYQIISRQVPRTVTRSVTYSVFVIVNGRLVREQRVREVQSTVYETVYELVTIELPAANGKWFGPNAQTSAWTIAAINAAGLKIGYGIRQGTNIYGFVTIVSLPGSDIPTGTYLITGTTDETGPSEMESTE